MKMSLLSMCELWFFLFLYTYVEYNLSKLGGQFSHFRVEELLKAKDTGIFSQGNVIFSSNLISEMNEVFWLKFLLP